MAYTIHDTTIDGDRLVVSITAHRDSKDATADIVCTVPVLRPATEADVIRAIEDRVKNEQAQWDWAPRLAAIQAALDEKINVRTLTTAEKAG